MISTSRINAADQIQKFQWENGHWEHAFIAKANVSLALGFGALGAAPEVRHVSIVTCVLRVPCRRGNAGIASW